jgi:hypothetical protein
VPGLAAVGEWLFGLAARTAVHPAVVLRDALKK